MVKQHTDKRWNGVSIAKIDAKIIWIVRFCLKAKANPELNVAADSIYKEVANIYEMFWEMKLNEGADSIRAKACEQLHDLFLEIETDWSENVLDEDWERMGYQIMDVAEVFADAGRVMAHALDNIEEAEYPTEA